MPEARAFLLNPEVRYSSRAGPGAYGCDRGYSSGLSRPESGFGHRKKPLKPRAREVPARGSGVYQSLARCVVSRTLLTMPMLFVLLSLVFVVLRVMPGDPVSAMIGDRAPKHVIDEKRAELGLDKPIFVQYMEYLGSIARSTWAIR